MEKKFETVYITKFALTQGILEVQGEVTRSSTGDFVNWKEPGSWVSQYAHGKDWYRDRGLAVKRANELVAKKVKSLTTQLDKMKKLAFN